MLRHTVNPNDVVEWFDSFESASATLRERCTEQHFTATVRSSCLPIPPNILGYRPARKGTTKNYGRIDYRCSRGKTPGPGVNKTKMTGFQWKAKINYFSGRAAQDQDPWGITILDRTHNHEADINTKLSATYRRQVLKAVHEHDVEKDVESLSADGTSTFRTIAAELSQRYGITISREQVKGVQRRLRETTYNVISTTGKFLEVLQADGAFVKVFEDPVTQRPSRIFWVYPNSISHWRTHPEVFGLDNTYRTNRFNMPLLQIGGITGLNTNFVLSFALMSEEDTPSFEWCFRQVAILAEKEGIPTPSTFITDFHEPTKKALHTVFPNAAQQLCHWHMFKNVVHNVRRGWKGSSLGNFAGGRKAGPQLRVNTESDQYDDFPDDDLDPADAIATTLSETPEGPVQPTPRSTSATACGDGYENTPDGFTQAWRRMVYASTKELQEEIWATMQIHFGSQTGI